MCREMFFCFIVALTVANGEMLPKPDNQPSSGTIAKQIGAQNIKIDMIDPSTVNVMKPKIFELYNLTVSIGLETKLICKARGEPLPTIIFRKLGSSKPFVLGQNEDQRIILEERHEEKDEVLGTLIISGLLRSDDGLYECIAENQAGISYKTGHITVEFPPSFEKTKEQHRIAWVWQNHPGNLSCIPEAIPNATIVWKHNNVSINSDMTIFKQESFSPISHLIVKPWNDHRYYGKYECYASNRLGQESTWVELREAKIPGRIPQVKQHYITATTIKWYIEPPQYFETLPIRAFTVRYKRKEEDFARNHIWSFPFPSSYYSLTKLVPEESYQFQFAASNDVGWGPFTNGPTITMPRKAQPVEPKIYVTEYISEKNTSTTEDVDTFSPYADRFTLKWEIPNANGEPIDSYLIRYCVIDEEGRDADCSEIKLSAEDTSYELHSLKSDTIYETQLHAHNLVGSSSAAQIRVKTARVANGEMLPKPDNQPSSGTIAKQIGAQNIKIEMIDPSTVNVMKPKIFELYNLTVSIGLETKLICKARGEPLPTIIFRKLGSSKPFVLGQNEDQRIILEERHEKKDEVLGTLIISGLLRSDDGLYECIAENQAGISYKTGHITVEFPPSFEKTKEQHRIAWAWQNHPGNLSCIPEAIPNATIVWKHNKVSINSDMTIFKQESFSPISHLIVKPWNDHRYYGKYECYASSRLGSKSIWVELREAKIPERIPQVKPHYITATTIRWYIKPPQYFETLPIRAFTVRYKRKEEDFARNHIWSFPFPSSYYSLTKLVPEETYQFQFAASNDVGWGPFTNGPTITMPRKAQPVEPKIYVTEYISEKNTSTTEDVHTFSPYADRFTLKWEIPNDNGEPIDSYLIRYCVIDEEGQDADCSEEIKLSAEYTSYELHSLKSDTIYEIQLRAHNLVGSSSAAQIRVKTARVPSSFYVLTNLVPKETYQFQFAASNDVGPFTNDPTITMPRKAQPVEPKIYVTEYISEKNTSTAEDVDTFSPYVDRFTLKWEIPNDNGEPIDSYLIRYCVIDEERRDADCSEIKLSAEDTSYELHSLKSDTIYEIQLRAHNLVGSSSAAQIRVKTARDMIQKVVGELSWTTCLDYPVVGMILIAVILLILILIDVYCFYVKRAGILAFICDRNKQKHLRKNSKLNREDDGEPIKSGSQMNDDRNISVEFDGKHVHL